MKAMVIQKVCRIEENVKPLKMVDFKTPIPKAEEVLIKVKTCGVCHTELDEIEGRVLPAFFPIIPGHQVVGEVIGLGQDVKHFEIGDRVGVAWILDACGVCEYCQAGEENLCQQFRATGRDWHGGYAEFMTASEKFSYKIPQAFSDLEAAPLLCAGAIGYRALRLSEISDGQYLGLTGFGASGHLVMKMISHKYPNTKVFVFARNAKERSFAKKLGAAWSGDTTERPPLLLDAIIDTTPVWRPVLEGLACLKPGGRLVINAIRKEKIDQKVLLELDYGKHLWMEKEIKSVANITRRDVQEFLSMAAQIPIKPHIQEYAFQHANQALVDLKLGNIQGAKVLRITS